MAILEYGVFWAEGGGTTGNVYQMTNLQEVSFTKGRAWATDPYDPPTCTLTFRDPDNVPQVGYWVVLTNNDQQVSGDVLFMGTVKDVQVDYGIKTTMDYVTIYLEGALARWGRRQFNSRSIAQDNTLDQIDTLATAIGFGSFTQASGGLSIASAQTYTGNGLDLINQIMLTEMGHLGEVGTYSNAVPTVLVVSPLIVFLRRNAAAAVSYTFADDSTADGIRYENIGFASAAQNYYTEATIQPLGLATQTAGSGFYNITQESVDYTTGQALSHAQYLVGQYNSTARTLYSITASYSRQDTTTRQNEFKELLRAGFSLSGTLHKIIFRSNTYYGVVEGMQLTADTSETTIQITYSAYDNNNYLILNDAVFGTLGTSGTYPGNKLGF